MIQIKCYKRIAHPVEALQYDGTDESRAAVCDFISDGTGILSILEDENGETGIYITTNDSVMHLAINDYVICDEQRLYYVMLPDIFKATYEEIL
jgi:hypothetical protein